MFKNEYTLTENNLSNWMKLGNIIFYLELIILLISLIWFVGTIIASLNLARFFK